MLSDFTLGGVIGHGATSTVYEAVHSRSGTRVALKALDATQGPNLRVVQAEIRAMAQVEHANLLGVLDHGLVTRSGGPLPVGTAWLALDYASGGSLEGWRPPDWPTALEMLVDLLSGLAHAHSRGLLHRDLKPANLLRCTVQDTRPGLKIADFGLAWVMGSEDGLRCGTPMYMAPEQNERDGDLGPWTDLYAVGNLLFDWTTGRLPFVRDTVEATLAAQRDATLPAYEPSFRVPDGLSMLIANLLQKEPSRRPSSAAWVAWALQRLPEPTFERWVPVHAHTPESVSPVRNLTQGLGLGLLPMRDFPVIGRDVARERIWACIEPLQQGRAQVVLLSGPRGVGRSRLALWTLRRVWETGVAEPFRVSNGRVKNLLSGELGPLVSVWARQRTEPAVVVLDSTMNIAAIDLFTTLLIERPDTPILVIGPDADPTFDWSTFEARPGFLHLDLGPIPSSNLQTFAHDGLGLAYDLAADVALLADGFVGRALRLTRTWVERDQLVGTERGLALREGTAIAWPHVDHRHYRTLLRAEPHGQAALELYAELHAVGAQAQWDPVLQVFATERPTTLLEALAEAHLVHLDPFLVLDPGLLVHLQQSFARSPSSGARRIAMAVGLGMPAKALMLYRAGQTSEAVERLTAWLERDDIDPPLQLAARRLWANGMAEGSVAARFLAHFAHVRARIYTDGAFPALEDLDHLVTHVAPGNERQRRMLHQRAAKYFWYAEHYDRAEHHLDQAELSPLEEALMRGLIRMDSGRDAEGMPLLLRVVREGEPHQICRAANGLGRLALLAEQPERAIQWFEEMFATSETRRQRAVALLNMGTARLDLAQWDRAEEVLNRALATLEYKPAWIGYVALGLTLVGIATHRPALAKRNAERALTFLRSAEVEDEAILYRIARRIDPGTPAEVELLARIVTLLRDRVT